MNLNQIIMASLERLGRGNDTQTIDAYRDVFKDYANRAVKKIALRLKQCRKETVSLADGQFDVGSLSHECFRVEEVRANNKPVDFWQDIPGSGTFRCDTKESSVDVIYRFVPKNLENTIDVPEIPGHTHSLIVHYVVACERCGGDPGTQGVSSADFQMFYEGLKELLPANRGEPRSFKLMNY